MAPADTQAPLPQRDELPKKIIFQTIYVQSLPREKVGLFVLTSCMSILDITLVLRYTVNYVYRQ